MLERVRQVLIGLSFSLLAIVISIVAAEILLRVFPDKMEHYRRNSTLFYEYDSLLGWKKIPGAREMRVADEYEVLECFNSKGIRGPEYSYGKADDEYRILILGDSFAHGYTVEFDQLFSEKLKRRLNKGIKREQKYYQVINCGTGGWSTDQELLFFQSEGKKYNPDLTILLFTSNDVWYNNQPRFCYYHKPLFEIEEGSLSLTNVPVPQPVFRTSLTQYAASQAPMADRIKVWLMENSYLYRFTTRRIKKNYYLYSLAIKLHLAEHPGGDDIVPIPDEFGVFRKTYLASIRDAWRITEAMIIKLQREAASVGSKLLLFYVPPRPAINKKCWQDTKRKYGFSDEVWDVNQPGIELEAICRRDNIDFFNPTEVFRTTFVKEGKQLHFEKDGHWNIDGHELAGKILAEHVFNGL